MPVLSHPLSGKVFPDVQRKSPLFQCVPVASGPVTGHHWQEPVSVLSAPSLQVFIHVDEIPLEPSLLQAEQPWLSQPLLVGEMLQSFNHLHGPLLDYPARLYLSCGCVPSGPRDLHVSSSLKYSLAWSSSTKRTPSLLQFFHLVSGTWEFQSLCFLYVHPANDTVKLLLNLLFYFSGTSMQWLWNVSLHFSFLRFP